MTAISWTKGNAPRKYTRRALFFDSLVIPKKHTGLRNILFW